MRSKWIWGSLCILLLLAAVTSTAAYEVIQGDVCVVESNNVISGNLFVLCRTFILNGVVEGNVFGAAINAQINGEIHDSLYMAAGQLDIRGKLGEDLIFGGVVLHLHPSSELTYARADIISASLSTRIAENIIIPGDVISLGYQLRIAGTVEGEVIFSGSSLSITGAVQGDLTASVGDSLSDASSQVETLMIPFRFLDFDIQLDRPGLLIGGDASIGGRVRYSAPRAATITGTLASEPIFDQIVTRPDFIQNEISSEGNVTWFSLYAGRVVQEIITLGLIGGVWMLVLPRQVLTPLYNIRRRPLSSLGIGILTFILSFTLWIVVLLLIVLVILILLALQLSDLVLIGLMTIGVVNIGGAAVFYFVAIYVSRVVLSLAIGRVLVRLTARQDSPQAYYISLVVGVILLSLLTWLPVVGSLISAMGLALGLGAIVIHITRIQFREPPRPQPAQVWPTLAEQFDSRRTLPPPVIDDRVQGPGAENLPEGFNWWGEDR